MIPFYYSYFKENRDNRLTSNSFRFRFVNINNYLNINEDGYFIPNKTYNDSLNLLINSSNIEIRNIDNYKGFILKELVVKK